MGGPAPVEADGQDGDVEDGSEREEEVANDLADCLCLRPKIREFYPEIHNYLPVTRVNEV